MHTSIRTTEQSLASHITLLKKDGSSSPSLLHKALLTLCLLMASAGVWAEDYILTNGTTYDNGTAYMACVNGQLYKAASFDENTCVWHCEDGSETSTTMEEGKSVYLYQLVNGVKYYIYYDNAVNVGPTKGQVTLSGGFLKFAGYGWNPYIRTNMGWGNAGFAYDGGSGDVRTFEYSTGVGSYSVSLSGGIVGGSVERSANRAEAGETVTLTATPADGYAFINNVSNWVVKDADNNDVIISIVGENQCTFIMPDKNVTVSASFLKVNTITMLTNPPTIWAGNQSLTWTPWAIVSNTLLQSNIGNHLVITYKANNGGVVRFISEDWGWHPQNDANWDINVNNDGFIDKEITQELLDNLNGKNLALVGQNASVTSIDFADENGDQKIGGTITATVNSNPATYAMEGDVVTLSVEPNPGFKFELWVVTNENGSAITVTDDTFTMPNGNVSVMAVFSEVQIKTTGYVIYSGGTDGEYLANDVKGTSSFDPKTCIWTGGNGAQFSNEINGTTYYLYNNNTLITTTARSATICYLGGTESNTTGQTLRLAQNGQYLRYYNGSYTRNNTASNASPVVFSVNKEVVDELSTAPNVTDGPNVFAQTGSGEYAHTVAVYRLGYNNYIFYNNTPHYFDKDDNIGYGTQQPQPEEFSYSWSLSGGDTDNGHVKVNATSGKVEYYNYYNDDTDVTLVLTATSANKTFTVEKVITFQYLRVNPNSITVDDSKTLYVGEDYTIDVTLDPVNAYRVLEFSSADESIATVDDKGVVTAKAIGTTSITVQALTKEDTRPANLRSTITLAVKEKVAIPVITFAPQADGLTALTTLTTNTTGASIYYTIDGDDPTSASTLYTEPFVVDNLQAVKAIAIMTGTDAEYYDNSNVAELMYSAKQVPTPTINVRGYEVTFSCYESGVTYYYTTDGSDPTTSSTQWNASTINSSAGTTIKVFATKTGLAPSDVASVTLKTAHVVYLRLAGAQGKRDGSSVGNEVGTWKDAYDKLGYGPNAEYLLGQWKANNLTALSGHNNIKNVSDFSNTVDNNIIYLVGDVTANQLQDLFSVTYWTGSLLDWNVGRNGNDHTPNNYSDCQKNVLDAGFMKPATISGKYATNNGYSTITFPVSSNTTLNEDTRFEHINFQAGANNNFLQLMCAYYDLEMGEEVRMEGMYGVPETSEYDTGCAPDAKVPHFQIFGGYQNDCRFGSNANSELNFDKFLPHPNGFKIKLRSGYYSTVCVGGKKWAVNGVNGMMGSPNMPIKCTIEVDIDHSFNDNHKTPITGSKEANYDVGAILAGNHEGAMYGDVDIIVRSGRISRIVNGTLGANRAVGNYPTDSYFGRANVLIDPRDPSSTETSYEDKNAMVVVQELYGGGLGRWQSGTDQIATYFYGESSVTINGGTFRSAIYAAGAGGVNGIGEDGRHTNDGKLPYGNLTNGKWSSVSYGGFDNNKTNILNFYVLCKDDNKQERVKVYLKDTSSNIVIKGGKFGSQESSIPGIFGGGYGFVDKKLVDYTTAGRNPNTQAGTIFGSSNVTIKGGDIWGNIYGAGRGATEYYSDANSKVTKANYKALGQVTGDVTLTIDSVAVLHGDVYGSGKGFNDANLPDMARLYGSTTLTIGGGATITGNVYGGGENGATDGNTEVNIKENASIGTNGSKDVYGGGALANVGGNTNVNLLGGTVKNVYGGGLGDASTAALVNGNTTVTLDGSIVNGNIFGANNVNGTPQGHAKVHVKSTSLRSGQTYDVAAIYGGGNQADYVPTSNTDFAEVLVENCGNSIDYVYGGGNAAAVPQAKVTINGGKFNYVFAGGNGAGTGNPGADVGYQNHTNTAYGTGTAEAIVHGGVINHLFAGSNEKGRIRVSQSVSVDHESSCDENILEVYGGGNLADSNAGSVTIGCGSIVGDVYGGANQANISSDIVLDITGGTINRVFGGNNTSGNVSGSITVNVNKSSECDLDLNYVYGGGNQAAYTPTTPGAYPAVNILNGTIKRDVFGGGLGATAIVTSNPVVTIDGGNVSGSVFGGGSEAKTLGNPVVNVVKGSVEQDAYGGGALADVIGNTSVSLTGGTVKDVYGGGLGRLADAGAGITAVAALVEGNTLVTLNGSVVTGQVFGANNLNGTPQGSTKVLVQKTMPQPGAAQDAYHVAAVYGGGNLAAHIPNDANLATAVSEVVVEGCDNSIEYVYGGGNAASTPATKVTINGGEMDYVFGGGNGKTEDGATTPNPGADVGYKDFTYDDAHAYGKGTTEVNIWGGVINSVFGGSNTKGNIRVSSNVNLDDKTETTHCTFNVGQVYGAGNEAEMYGNGNLVLGCIPGLEEIYGGAKNADIHGDVTMTVTNGTFGKVFGGNNLGGKINGAIIVNIDETGCKPVVIEELYGGGNLADYIAPTDSKYGENAGKFPQVNLISATRIGTVYGAGKGASEGDDAGKGIVTGTPVVNINQIPGLYAARIGKAETDPDGDATRLGEIGTVFGGGNAAKVVGGTTVNIGTVATAKHVSGSDKTIYNAGANITGNVYGGGNQADVTGKTNVTVGRQ